MDKSGHGKRGGVMSHTPGPWETFDGEFYAIIRQEGVKNGIEIAHVRGREDADLIAAAPSMKDEVDRLKTENQAFQDLIEEIFLSTAGSSGIRYYRGDKFVQWYEFEWIEKMKKIIGKTMKTGQVFIDLQSSGGRWINLRKINEEDDTINEFEFRFWCYCSSLRIDESKNNDKKWVLQCLLEEIKTVKLTFDEYCTFNNVDTDSRKALDDYLEMQERCRSFVSFLGPDLRLIQLMNKENRLEEIIYVKKKARGDE